GSGRIIHRGPVRLGAGAGLRSRAPCHGSGIPRMNVTALFAVAFASLATTWLTRTWARRALLDQPTERSSHSIPTPRGGGLGILAGLAAGAALEPSLRDSRVGVLLAAIAAISFADDLRPLGSRTRLVAHVALAALAVGVVGDL